MTRSPKVHTQLGTQLGRDAVRVFAANERVNQMLIEHLDVAAWDAKPPGGKGRTIQAIVAHMHNVRVMWLKATAKGSKIPDQLDRSRATPRR